MATRPLPLLTSQPRAPAASAVAPSVGPAAIATEIAALARTYAAEIATSQNSSVNLSVGPSLSHPLD